MPMLSVRMTTDQYVALRFAASRYGTCASKFVRHLLSNAGAAAAPGPMRAKIADAAVALGLPKDSDPSEVLRTLELVVADLEASEGAPASSDDAAQPYAGLSKADREKLARMTPEQRQRFAELRARHQKPSAQLSAASRYELTDIEKKHRDQLPTPEQRDAFTKARVAKGEAEIARQARKRAAARGNIL